MAAVPKAANKTIRYAKVKACYYNNTNAAYFDNISMTEEPVQTYKYDDSSPKLDVSYSYRTRNSTNQLTKEIRSARTSDYAYDTYGNIRSKTNSYSDGATDSYSYSYENAEWLDLLTKVSYTDKNGTTSTQSLTYDSIGNPLNYFNGKKNWNFTWKNGRELSAATDGTTTVTNTYDVDGIRETKTVNGVTHSYTTLGGKIVREVYGSNIIDYFYDNSGRPYKLVINENGSTSTGYFVLNLQGDVIAILDSSGAVAVEYEYDAWGKETGHTTSGSSGNSLYSYNALKYRGYYYDAETGFYYVSSRYYDPEVGRFISADTTDVLMASPTALTDKNLYAYCDNNPVIRIDEYGDMWELAVAGGGTMAVSSGFSLSALGGSVAAAVGAITPLGWVAIGTVVAITAVSVGIKYSKAKAKKGTKTRINSPIGRRNNYNSRKRAKEAAKKAGGGKEPIKHPKGFHGNKRPHYHPNVKNNYRLTPHGSSSHDHYFYPR